MVIQAFMIIKSTEAPKFNKEMPMGASSMIKFFKILEITELYNIILMIN